MTTSAVLDGIDALLGRLEVLFMNGSLDPNWSFEAEFIKNDTEALAERHFGKDTKDCQALIGAVHPFGSQYRGTAWSKFWTGYGDPIEKALRLVRHRLTEGQSVLKKSESDEVLIEPETPHSAYVKLRDLVESAAGDLMLVDPYVDRTLFDLLTNAKASVAIRILTRQTTLPGDFILEATKFRQQSKSKLSVRAGLTDFHDRFLIVDERLFTSGASFKDLGRKGSVVTEITEIRDQAMPALASRWNTANVLA